MCLRGLVDFYISRYIMNSQIVCDIILISFGIVLLLTDPYPIQRHTMMIQNGVRVIHYDRVQLLELRSKDNPLPPCYANQDCFYTTSSNRRKRGKKGGIRQKLKRRGFRPSLPSIILANVRSIRNKVDEISAHVRYNNVFRESCIMCFTETWLDTDDNDNFTTIDGFSCVRSDRTAESNKKKGGGLCVYINNKFCNNYTVKKKDVLS